MNFGTTQQYQKLTCGTRVLNAKHRDDTKFIKWLQTALYAFSSVLSRTHCLGSHPHCFDHLLWQSSVLWFGYIFLIHGSNMQHINCKRVCRFCGVFHLFVWKMHTVVTSFISNYNALPHTNKLRCCWLVFCKQKCRETSKKN